ncbi:hypothetical protein GBF38_017713 [Nibea albiflora]|uniref:Uncharacterized protein n=1 Tax=Nibea albiflora TaxID=240163 RepID=A0ACB7F588_NIBAL|nr:hypothetical protein GBF38_017713 [Nibea albiflora]
MMTFQVNASLPTAKALISEGSSNCSQRGPGAVGYPAYRNFGMGAGGGQAAFRQSHHTRRKFPVIQPLSKSKDWRALVSGIIAGGSPHLAKDDKLESENDPKKDICGRHFLFDKKYQSYPDPMVGAPRSFSHRISELSSLEGETVRQEKLKKMRKPKKPPS